MNTRDYSLHVTRVAEIIYDVDTDDRGNFYEDVADYLEENFTQHYTARLFRDMALEYGLKG